MEDTKGHVPVLLQESILALALKKGDVVVDATGGGGGHSRALLEIVGEQGSLIVFDQDPSTAKELTELFKSDARVTVVCENFRNLVSATREITNEPVQGVLMDLGWNTLQFSEGGKGFSFLKDEPLLMTFGDPKKYSFTATDIVNSWSEETLSDVFFGYGEERYARKIARKVVEVRARTPILTTGQLVEVVKLATPHGYQRGRLHPATKTFQALRIAVNDELDALKEGIEGALTILATQGRLAVISFHSIEDRIVKRAFLEAARVERGTVITKKPIVAQKKEVAQNPRARSAKLRVFEKSS